MSYIGNTPNFQQFAVQTEDGNAASYALDYTPGSATAILVFVDGVHQKPTTDYTVSGSTLTPVALWPAGTGNVIILFLGRAADVPTPADASVTTAKIVDGAVETAKLDDGAVTHAKVTYNAGQMIQSVYAEYLLSAALTTVVPWDDTIPQNTEGDEILTATITPKYATSKIRIRFVGECVASAQNQIVAAVFKDSDASAITAVGCDVDRADAPGLLSLEYLHSPATVSAITYKVRVGPAAAGSVKMNGNHSAGRKFGGTMRSTLVLEEIAV